MVRKKASEIRRQVAPINYNFLAFIQEGFESLVWIMYYIVALRGVWIFLVLAAIASFF
jgi:uncharacterized membrane protein YuzA (DUF378 family)